MNRLYEMLVSCVGPFDIIFDPEIGPMELQEIGIEDRLEYNKRERFAYALEMNAAALRKLIADTAENLGIREGEKEIVDKLTDKVVKTCIEFDREPVECVFWVTIWHDVRVGTLHRQGKVEMFIKPHSDRSLGKFEYYDTKKKIWIRKIAEQFRAQSLEEIELDQLNDFIKKKNLLWLLEEVLVERYDIWDFLEDINRQIGG
jgi:hypothetical protein